MPYLKQIAAHTGCQNIQRYLEKGGRALAKDFFNLSIDERDGYGDEGKDGVRWADEMDETRRRFGNDAPFGGRAARTYKHFVISPDPEDDIDLESLRELACAWAIKHFDGYQIAIIYHDDNEGHIPHAHVVVNNTDLATGLRMHHDDPKEFNRSLQEMARERSLLFLTDVPEAKEGLERLAGKGAPVKARPKTMQQVHIGRAERELAAAGSYSWVADIRNRVSVAKTLARNTEEFHQVLDMLGVKASDNSRASKRDDWIYSLAGSPSRKVSGERLGLLFSKETVLRQMRRAGAYRPDARTSKEILSNAREAVLVNDLDDLSELSSALRTCAYHGVSSIQECTRKLAALRKRADGVEGRSKANILRRAGELEAARDYMEAHELLPNQLTCKHPAGDHGQQGGSSSKHRNGHVEAAASKERQQEPALERSQR